MGREEDRPAPPPGEVTGLLLAWTDGDRQALESLVPLVHGELHRLARRRMQGERRDHTLQPTALVNEAYLRLTKGQPVPWRDRAHFFAVSARLMRRILVDHGRSRRYLKRGGGAPQVCFDETLMGPEQPALDVVALDDALNELARLDQRQSQVIELRFFGGLSVEEAATVLNVSPDTIKRDWRLAKVWLRRELKG